MRLAPPLAVAVAILVAACGGTDWQRPRSASDPSDVDAVEAVPRPPPSTLAAELPLPSEAPASGHEHHHHHSAAPAEERPAGAGEGP